MFAKARSPMANNDETSMSHALAVRAFYLDLVVFWKRFTTVNFWRNGDRAQNGKLSAD